MTISRRHFLEGSTTTVVAAAAASLIQTRPVQAQPSAAPSQQLDMPPLAIIALNRIGFGPRPGDIDAFERRGSTPEAQLEAYVDEQLNPVDSQDIDCNQKLANVLLRIAYGPAGNRIEEDRPLSNLTKSREALWTLANNREVDRAERLRPFDEVKAATWIRAVYSKWQLREVLVEFWHNHFNVNANTASGGEKVRATWPLYDALMREHCLGNFRTFLGDVAQSIAMNYYLNNNTNRVAGPNENYARELFELHTLGADNYYNDLYDEWRAIPGATDDPPEPIGYIDEDVYEAARAFTGWKIADGTRSNGVTVPNTGEFITVEAWTDRFQKRVLATEMTSNLTPLQYGDQVLDLVAYHPGTARYVCTKLCRRLVADDPPSGLVNRAVQVWMANQFADDQIQQVVRTILLSPEFANTWGQKVKRPFELVVSFIRALGMDFPPRDIFNNNLIFSSALQDMGFHMFTWPTPTGHPDVATYWLSTNVTLRRWRILNDMLGKRFWRLPNEGADPINIRDETPSNRQTSAEIVAYWVERVLGRTVDSNTLQVLIDFMRDENDADAPPDGNDNDLFNRYNYLVTLIAMTPDFQWR